jgi:hypothetical protein
MNSSKSIRESSPRRQLIDYRVPKCRRLSRSITSRIPPPKKSRQWTPGSYPICCCYEKKFLLFYIFPALFIEKKERPLSVAHYYSEPSSTIASCCVYKHVGTETGPESCPRLVSRPVSLSLSLSPVFPSFTPISRVHPPVYLNVYKKLYEHHLYILFVYKDCFNWDKLTSAHRNFTGKINERVKGDFISFVFSTMGNFFDQFFFL